MVIQTRKSLKQTLLEKLGNIGEVAFPLLGIAKKTYIETPLSTANKLNQEANRLTQLAEQEQDINRKRELYRQSLNLSQQAAQLSQKSASNVPKVIGAGQLALKGAGIAAGGALSAPTKIAGITKGLTQATSGSVADIITSKLLPGQMKAVEEQRQKDILKAYRTKYPEAPVSPTLPFSEQERAYKEYLKTPYLQTYKPTLPTGYKEPQTIIGQTWEGVRSGTLNTLLPSIMKSAQSVLNKAGLYDVSGQLENKAQQLQAYAQSRLDLQSPNFSELFKQNPANASKLYVARMFGETLPYIGAMVIPPLLTRQSNYFTTIAPIQFVEKGTFLRDIENTVQDKTAADSLATIYGGINAIIENSLGYTPAGLAKWLSQPVQQVSRNAFLRVIKSLPRTAVRILVNSINEGNEEVLQQIAENILRKWAGDKSVQTTLTDLAQNWLGGFAGSLPLGVSQIGTTQAGLTVQPTIGNEAIGQTDKQGRTIVNITPMENTYAVSYMDETGKVDGMVLTPDKFKEYLQKNFPQIQITSPETTPELELLKRKKEYLVEQNEQINERLEELEDRGQMGTDLYNKLENQREQNGKAIQELTNQINTLQQSLPQPAEIPKVEGGAKEEVKPIPKELESLAQEARKYKSADEFVNEHLRTANQNELYQRIRQLAREIKTPEQIKQAVLSEFGTDPEITLYRGISPSLRSSPFESDITSKVGRFWTPNKAHAELFIREKGKMYELKIKASDLLKARLNKQAELWPGEVRLSKELQQTAKESLTKSQLTDFYNQATKGTKEVKPEVKPIPKELKLSTDKSYFIAKQPIKLYKGIGDNININRFAWGQHFADNSQFASQFGKTIIQDQIPANTKIANLDTIKEQYRNNQIIADPKKVTQDLIDKGFEWAVATMPDGQKEYIHLEGAKSGWQSAGDWLSGEPIQWIGGKTPETSKFVITDKVDTNNEATGKYNLYTGNGQLIKTFNSISEATDYADKLLKPQPVVEKATPAVEENLPETTSFAINQALLRLAKQQGIPIDRLPTHEVENIKQTVKTTTDWYNSLTPEQKDTYITSGQLPPNISKPIFADLYSKEAIKGDTTKQRLLLESPIYQELTEAGRLLREQKEVVDSTVEVVKTVQEAKKQRAKKLLGVEPEIASQRTQKRLLNEINLKSLESIIAKHPTLQNPNLINAVKSGTLNLLELSNKSYQEIVEALSPYISDPITSREASLELEGKQFLTRVKAGITFWIKKWGIGKNILTDQEIQQQTDNLIDALQNRKLEWQEQQREFKRFANILTGLELTDAELKKALEIADVLITTRSLPDFQTLPEDDPRIVKYAQAELSFLHLKDEIEGLNVNLPQWWQSVHQTILSTWKEQGFWKAADTVFKELNDLSIALKASLDNSFIFRQGRYTLLSNPKAWLEGAKKSFEAWFKSNPSQVIDSYLLDYFKDPLYRNGFYVKTKVVNVNLELYPSEVPTKLPLIGNIFQRSIAAYTSAQVEMRKGVAKYMWNLYQGHSITVGGETRTIDFLTNKNDLQAAKEIIGVSTASGLTERKGISHYLVWSRNLITSDLKTFSNLVGAWTSDIPEFKKVQIKQAWTRLVGILAFQYLINILLRSIYKDWDENPIVIDPTDQRFGEIYLGKDIKFRDPLLTIVNLVCTVGSTALGKGYRSRTTRERVKVGQYGFDPFGDLIVGYFQNKFTPAARILIDIVNNEMFGGKKITVGRIGEALFTPIVLENISELKDVEKWRQPSAIIAIIADAFGLNTTTMIHRVQLDKTIADEVDRLQGLDIPDIQAGRYDGFINEFKSLSTKENQHFFEVLSEQLDTQLTQLIESKPYQAASDEQKADAIQRLYDNIFHTTKIYWIQHKLNQCKTQEEGYQLLYKYTEQGFLNDGLYRDLVQYGVIPYSLIQYAQSKQK